MKTSFHIIRDSLNSNSSGLDDDVTVDCGPLSSSLFRTRMSLMVTVPGTDKDIDKDEAPIKVIRKINLMIKSLINRIPSVKLGHWLHTENKKNKYLLELPEDVDIVEKYVHDLNRFLSPGGRIYRRINVFYNGKKTNLSEIESISQGFKKPRIQFLQLAFSDSTSPMQMGTLTRLVKSMATLPDFQYTFQKLFKLKHIGLWWDFPKGENTGQFTVKKFAVHYEIDRTDEGDNTDIIKYFNKHLSLVDKNILGTPLSVVPIFKPFLEDEIKLKVTKYSRKQLLLESNIRSTTISGTQILNWCDSKKKNTLHRQLMQVESIYTKTVIRNTGNTDFKGRLFYAIIPNQSSKNIVFYYSKANKEEARSVVRVLPVFIRDYFNLQPSFFYSTDAISELMQGEWDFKNGHF